MPVTARLSSRFYERFGDEITNELVEWFNSVDATYRADLKEVNELNFARFDAKVEQRFAQQDARFEKRFAEQDARFEKRFAEQDARFEKRFVEIDKRFAAQDVLIATTAATTKTQIISWMVGLWLTSALAVGALLFRGL